MADLTKAIHDWREDKGTFPSKVYLSPGYFVNSKVQPGRKIPGTYKGETYELELLLDPKVSDYRLEE